MNDTLPRRLHAAVVAGWWTVGIAWVIFLAGWRGYLGIMSARPGWVLALLGSGVTWDEARTIYLFAFVAMKMLVWLMLMVVVWLTLWARQLRRA